MTDQDDQEVAAVCERCGHPCPKTIREGSRGTAVEEKTLRRPALVDEQLRERDG